MSQELIEFAEGFLAGNVSAEDFALSYMCRWKKERDSGVLLLDAPDISEKCSTLFCMADLFNPDSDRFDYEFDENRLRREVQRVLRGDEPPA